MPNNPPNPQKTVLTPKPLIQPQLRNPIPPINYFPPSINPLQNPNPSNKIPIPHRPLLLILILASSPNPKTQTPVPQENKISIISGREWEI